MLLSLFLVSACLFMQRGVLHHMVSEDRLEWSGNALKSGHIWVLVTGSLVHASLSHEINNLLFTFAVCTFMEDQLQISKSLTLAVFTLTGAMGWIASFIYHYHLHGELALFIPSRGYSPNMYGAAFFVLMINGHDIMRNICSFHPICWILAIIAVPTYFSENPQHRAWIWTIIVIAIGLLTKWLFDYSLLLQEMTMGTFLVLYFVKCFIGFGYNRFILRMNRPSVSDHMCHLGGAIGGTVMGICYLFLYGRRYDEDIWLAVTRWDFIISIVFLYIRLRFNV